MPDLSIDFETRSAADLRAVGLDNYAKHPTTDIWCMAYAVDDHEVKLIERSQFENESLRRYMWDYLKRPDVTLVAHNAFFELAVWNEILHKRYGWPPLRIGQMRCTMAMCYAMALPGDLDRASAALGITERKDMAGSRLMLQMAKPREVKPDGTIVWWDDAERLEKLYAYCRQDVRVERELDKRLLQISPSERQLWEIDHEINSRGITVDRRAVEAASQVVEYEQRRLSARIREVTGNFVGVPTEHKRLTDWVRSRGVETSGVAKADVVDLLAQDTLPDDVRSALEIRREYAKSSTAKLKAMLNAASTTDDRLRGMFQYHGAGTGRWAGRKVQLHNMPRGSLKPSAAAQAIQFILSMTPKEAAEALTMLYGSPLDVISSCLRAFLVAKAGCVLMAGDFSNIEGRVLAWLAGEEWKLQAFRDFDAGTGPDLYLVTAGKIYNQPPSAYNKLSPEREVGKRCELAFGFGGGVGAWRKFEVYATKDYVPFSDEKVEEIKWAWRDAHAFIAQYWGQLEGAARAALKYPGTLCQAGAPGAEVKYRKAGSFLWCLLPSGRVLCYPYARLDKGHEFYFNTGGKVVYSQQRLDQYGPPKDCHPGRVDDDVIFYMSLDGVTNKWVEDNTYGGKLSENVTQAVARDALADAMKRLKAKNADIVLHVHDEIVIEVPEANAKAAWPVFTSTMSETPPWAAGLPIAVAGWYGRRYRKD